MNEDQLDLYAYSRNFISLLHLRILMTTEISMYLNGESYDDMRNIFTLAKDIERFEEKNISYQNKLRSLL